MDLKDVGLMLYLDELPGSIKPISFDTLLPPIHFNIILISIK